MTTDLKTLIEKRFEFDGGRVFSESCLKLIETGFKMTAVDGARWQHNQIKSEVLPIFLELANDLETMQLGIVIEPKPDLTMAVHRALKALERLRKWSET